MDQERDVFEYETTMARMDLQTRIEKHGKENSGAVTLSFVIDCPNTILNYLQPGLLQALYRGDVDPQADLDAEHLPTVKFPQLPELKWVKLCASHQLSILGPGGRRRVIMTGCELKDFKLKPKQGGTVELSFKANGHPEPEDVSTLYKHNGQLVELTTVAEDLEVPAQGDMVGEEHDDS